MCILSSAFVCSRNKVAICRLLRTSILINLFVFLSRVLYSLHLSRADPSSTLFKEAFNVASSQNALGDVLSGGATPPVSAWPMVLFLSFIFAAPYVIMKLVGRPDTTKLEQAKDPRTWTQPIASQASFTFQATSPQELSVSAGEMVYVAPKEIQNSFRLMNTGWAMATKDFQTAGMVPINYLQRQQQQQPPQNHIPQRPPADLMMNSNNRVFPVQESAILPTMTTATVENSIDLNNFNSSSSPTTSEA